MKKLSLILLIFLTFGASAMNSSADELMELWDRIFTNNGLVVDQEIKEKLSEIKGTDLPDDVYRLRLIVAKNSQGLEVLNEDYPLQSWTRETALSYLSLKETYGEFLNLKLTKSLADLEEEFAKAKEREIWREEDIRRLLNFNPKRSWGFLGFGKRPTLYLLCRQNREQKCLMVMKDKKGRWVRGRDGRLWSQPKLAMSSRGLPAHQVNGETPQGVFLINSVMPLADQNLIFGQYRRLKLDFVSKSDNEEELLDLIPRELRRYNWWRENIIARDIGRSLLRIHGTGLINDDPASSWYPLYPTSGCIASRENSYDGITYKDQQELLDTMMEASGLRVRYSNEEDLEGVLYVVNIDDQEAPVTLSEIESYL